MVFIFFALVDLSGKVKKGGGLRLIVSSSQQLKQNKSAEAEASPASAGVSQLVHIFKNIQIHSLNRRS